jgi:hypothetical protein
MLAPTLLFLLLDQRSIINASLIAHVYMIAIFVIASSAFLFSLFERGEVTSAEVDAIHGVIAIERTGLLARSVLKIPFTELRRCGWKRTTMATVIRHRFRCSFDDAENPATADWNDGDGHRDDARAIGGERLAAC